MWHERVSRASQWSESVERVSESGERSALHSGRGGEETEMGRGRRKEGTLGDRMGAHTSSTIDNTCGTGQVGTWNGNGKTKMEMEME
jgi:hypothetical protein